MRPSACIGILVAAALGSAQASATTAQPPTTRNVYTFPDNTFIENIAVRSNSQLLVTSMSVSNLFTIDPTAANPAASAIHTFPNATGITGIAESAPDVFALVTGVWHLAATRAQPGSRAIWTVDFTRRTTHL